MLKYPISKCVVVLGRSRSGTSVVSGCLHLLGVDMGNDLLPANKNNPRGFFEERPFINIHEKIIGGNWMNPRIKFQFYRDEYFRLVRRYSSKSLWGIKDPRMCGVFPYFLEAARGFCAIKVVNVCRPLLESAKSLVERHSGLTYNRNTSLSEAIELCEIYDSMKKDSLRLAKNVFEVSYPQLVDDAKNVIEELACFVGVEDFDIGEVLELVDPKLKHY